MTSGTRACGLPARTATAPAQGAGAVEGTCLCGVGHACRVHEVQGGRELKRPLADQTLRDDLLLDVVELVHEKQVLDYMPLVREVGLQTPRSNPIQSCASFRFLIPYSDLFGPACARAYGLR